MARQVLPIAGAIVGAYFGNPQLGYAIGSIVGNLVDPQVIKGPSIGDVAQQTSSEGVYQPILFGTCACAGNIIDQGPNIIRKVSSGGKGGPETQTERLYKSFAIRIGRGWNGPIAAITRIWEDGKLVYDVRPTSTILDESAKFAEGMRIYLGTQDQLPDPELEAIHGVGNAPAYVGRAYVVFIKKDITDRRSISDYKFEVSTSAEVVSVDALMSLEMGLGFYRGIHSPDAIDWTDAPFAIPGSLSELIATNGRYLGWAKSSFGAVVRFTDDNGANWSAATGSADIPSGGGAAEENVVLVASENGILRSLNNGDSFSLVPIGGATVGVALTNGFAVTIGPGVHFWYSANSGASWTDGVSVPFSISSGACIAALNGQVRAGGRGASSGPGQICITDGASATLMSLPAGVAEEVQAMAAGVINGQGVWIAGSQDGAVLRDIGSGWELCAGPAAGSVVKITYVGTGFLIGFSGPSTFLGKLYYTVDGSAFAEVTPPGDGRIMAIASNFTIDQAYGQPIPVDAAVLAIHDIVNQPPSEVDVSDLAGLEMEGLVLAGDYSAASAIRAIGSVYLFDSPQCDGKIRHLLRGSPVAYTFDINDLVDVPDDSKREQAIEFPRKLNMDYQNAEVDYAPAKETSTRSSADIRVVGETNFQTPVTMGKDYAAQLAAKLHKVSWAEAEGEVTFSVPDSFLRLIPSTPIAIALRETVRRLRVNEIGIQGGKLNLKCRIDRQSAYTSNVTGIPKPPVTPPPPSLILPSALAILDIPALADAHDLSAPVIYLGAGPTGDVWPGAVVQRSTDGGANYANEAEFSTPTIMGTLLADLASASEHYPDRTNTVYVDLDDEDEQLDSLTDQQWLSEGGAFAIENGDGTWELLQYRDSDQQSDGAYALSTLQRGRLATGGHPHTAGDRVVFLDAVRVATMPTSTIGMDVFHRAITNNLTAEQATVDDEVYTAQSQTEFPCADLFGELTSSGLTLTTVPRHRFGTEDNPVRSINWVGYRWTATDGASTVTAEGTSDTIDLDVTGLGTPVTATVAQINRITGPGPSISEVFE